MRAVLDVNVLVSALISPSGTPARLVEVWLQGAFDLVVSPLLLAELERTLAYRKLRSAIRADEAAAFVAVVVRSAVLADDPTTPPPARSADPGDDYLLALAAAASACLVSGDHHLLDLAPGLPVEPPAAFLARLEPSGS